jgi:cysteine-rich repeat protein
VCTATGCASPDQLAACAGAGDGDTCATRAFADGACVGGVCQPISCGDGKVVGTEVCDDGNQRSGDGCSADCRSRELCGNDYADVVVGEQCDSGISGLSRDGCTSRCTIEFDSWFLVTPTVPAVRDQHAMAYDQRRHRVVVFGGRGTISPLTETLEWDGAAWRTMHPATSPPITTQHPMAYDARRGRTVLFGGDGATWEWDGVVWEKHVTSPAPPKRSAAGMAYDATNQVVVLFGGTSFADTWTWDGTTWSQHVTSPSPPAGPASLAFEAAAGRVVGFMANGETWGWDGTRWTNLATTGPGARQFPALAADHAGQVVLYGGVGLHDTWEWTATGWITTSTPTHPGDLETAMAYDPDRDRVVLFGGGTDSAASSNQTWEWDGASWLQRSPQLGPGIRIVPSGAYLPLAGSLVTFGDLGSADTWVWDGSAWELQTPVTQPPGRLTTSMVATRDHVLLFGGNVVPNGRLNDTWEWSSSTWTQRHPVHAPSPRTTTALAYDQLRDRVVLFGGSSASGAVNDTWVWDGLDWSQLSPVHSPPAATNPQLACDDARGRCVLLVNGATWEWDGTDWIEMSPSANPTVFQPALAYDPTRERVILNGADNTNSGSTQTWEWDGASWTQLPSVTNPPNPGTVLAYDRVHGELVLYAATSTGDVWVHRFFSRAVPPDTCNDVDTDGDGLVGCADPDCWGRCTPVCPPDTTCDPGSPRCGDGTCSILEYSRLCPSDCSP